LQTTDGDPFGEALHNTIRQFDPKFGNSGTSLRGKRICVTGKISDYHGKAEIILFAARRL
jgi:hypothetical protein